MRTRQDTQMNFILENDIYERTVPKDHFLRELDSKINFSFVDRICESKYKGYGRPPETPERLFRLLLVLFLYQIKFETELIRQAMVNMAFRWFCKYKPTEELPDHSLFYVFRQRLGEEVFEQLLAKLIEQCIKAKLIDARRIYLDATDMKANAKTLSAFEQAVILARAVLEELKQKEQSQDSNSYIPPKEPSENMKRRVAEITAKMLKCKSSPKYVLKKLDPELGDISQGKVSSEPEEEMDEKEQKAIQKLAREKLKELPHTKGDPDAMVGTNGKRKHFTGYLVTTTVETSHQFITGVNVTPGNTRHDKAFGEVLNSHMNNVKEQKTEEVVTDSAYDWSEVHDRLKADEMTGYIKPREHRGGNSLQLGRDQFHLNEQNQMICPANKPMRTYLTKQEGIVRFTGVNCAECTLKEKCTKSKRDRILKVDLERHQQQEKLRELAQTQEYKQAMKDRLRIEGVFGHGKTFHNLGKALYRSLKMVKIQAIMVAIAINIEKVLAFGTFKEQLVPI